MRYIFVIFICFLAPIKIHGQCAVTISNPNPTICIGGSTTLTASGADIYSWGGGVSSETLAVSPTVTTSYTVTGTDGGGCSASFSITVYVQTPTITISTSTPSMCVGSYALLSASGADTYSWSTGSTLNIVYVNPTVTTEYTVDAITELGCPASAEITVMVYTSCPFPAPDWTDLDGTIFRNDTLINTTGWYNSSLSKNTLLANTDGWVEYVLTGTTQDVFFGFLDSAAISNSNPYTEIDNGFFTEGTNVYLFINGGYAGGLGSFEIGDVMRIERIDSTVYIIKNGVILTSYPVSNHEVWKLKVSFPYDPITDFRCSFIDSTSIYFPGYTRDIPKITHCAPGLDNGTISLTPFERSPHTYTWSPVSSTSTLITSLAPGKYTVQTKDPENNSSNYSYDVGYKTSWTNMDGVIFRNDSLINNIGSWISPVTKNTLTENTDGWAQYVTESLDAEIFLGFVDTLLRQNYNAYTQIDCGFYLELNRIYVFINGSYAAYLGFFQIGDVLKIQRIGSDFNLIKNGAIIYTYSGISNKPLKLMASIPYNSVSNIGCSFIDSTGFNFQGYVRDIPHIIHCTPGLENGSIQVTAIDRTPHSYTWMPTSSTNTIITNLVPGIYTLTSKDPENNTSKFPYNVGYKTGWHIIDEGTTFSNDSLINVNGNYNSVLSKNTLPAYTDGWADYVMEPLASGFFFGFLDSASINRNLPYSEIDYGLYIEANRIYAFINGSYAGIPSLFDIGDVLRIERIDTTFNIRRNGTIIYSLPVTKNKDCKLKISFPYNSISNVGCSFTDSIGVNFPGFVEASPVFIHTSGAGTNNGRIQLSPMPAGDHQTYLWQPSEETTSSVSNKEYGTYTVTIKDDLNNSSTQSYDILYKTKWEHLAGMTFRNDSLLPSEPYTDSYYSTAITSDTLKANTDGVVSWLVDDSYAYRAIGFTSATTFTAGDYTDIEQGFFENLNYLYYYSLDSYYFIDFVSPGDLLKIKRHNDTVDFYVNSKIIYSSYPTNTDVNWKLKTAIYVSYKLANVGSSFSGNQVPPCVYPNIQYSVSAFSPTSTVTFSVNQTGPTGGTYTYVAANPSNTLSINPTTGAITASLSSYGTYTVLYSLPESSLCISLYTATTVITFVNSACKVAVEPNRLKLCAGDQIQIQAFGGIDGYTWTPSAGLSCTNCSMPILTYTPSVTQYTVSSTNNGGFCGQFIINIINNTQCDEEDPIIGCCFSNYGAAVYVNDVNTHINVYCNVLNEISNLDPTNTVSHGQFENNGNINLTKDWIHNGQNTLYVTTSTLGIPQGTTSFFGNIDQNIKGNSNTHFNDLILNGNGKRIIWIDAFANGNLNLTSNEFVIQNYNFLMKNPTSDIYRTTGFASVLVNGYFSRKLDSYTVTPNKNYLYPLGTRASSVIPFRYRPLELFNNIGQQDEVSANFMNAAPSLTADPEFVSTNTAVTNVITDKVTNISQLNPNYYHKLKNTVTPTSVSDLIIKSFYPPIDGSYQSISEWRQHPSLLNDLWSTTPGASANNNPSTNAGTFGQIYAMANGTVNFSHKPFRLAISTIYVNTSSFIGNGPTIITVSPAPTNTTSVSTNTTNVTTASGPSTTVNSATTNVSNGVSTSTTSSTTGTVTTITTNTTITIGGITTSTTSSTTGTLTIVSTSTVTTGTGGVVTTTTSITAGASNTLVISSSSPTVAGVSSNTVTETSGSTTTTTVSVTNNTGNSSTTTSTVTAVTGTGTTVTTQTCVTNGVGNAAVTTCSTQVIGNPSISVTTTTVTAIGSNTVTPSTPTNAYLPGPFAITPNPTAGDYVLSISSLNNCDIPGKVKFTVTPSGTISTTNVMFGLASSNNYLGIISEDLYTIDNINIGITLNSVPKDILSACVNSISVSTSTNSDFVLNQSNSSEQLIVDIPFTLSNVLSIGTFDVYDASNSAIGSYSVSAATTNSFSISHASLATGVYNFVMAVNFQSQAGPITEQLKGQFIIK